MRRRAAVQQELQQKQREQVVEQKRKSAELKQMQLEANRIVVEQKKKEDAIER